MAIDFDKEFESFCSNNDSSAIQDIYAIIPTLTQKQMQIYNSLMFYVEKYELNDLEQYLISFLGNMKNNKNLNFINSMNVKNLLKAYTQEELIKGVKANVNRNPDL